MPRKILIVDDLAINRQILKKILEADYEIWEAASGQEALTILQDNYALISAVLLDIRMPEMDGFEVLSHMRNNSELVQIPVIMITASGDEESRVKALSLGANDYAMKPYNPDIIKHCLRNNITLHETVATVNALQRDSLTGLYNRETFFEKVQELILQQEPGYYVMACFDVDKFKVINDQYGMQKGDEILRHIAEVFKAGFETAGGVCCRISADDFGILYPASFQDSKEIVEIRQKAGTIPDLAVHIFFSIGRYVIDDLSLSPSAMYDRALLAADSVKGRYDTQIAYYDESMRNQLRQKQDIVMEMNSALANRQFEAWLQPQYNHATGALIGAEALARWRHPQKGLISPGLFIPIFEKNGFVYELDKYIWEEVCRYLRKWIDEGRNPLPVSVNISRYDIFQADLIKVIMGLLDKYRLSVNLLRLEITESAFIESAEQIISVVEKLLALGFTIEIDDFGSGYSSLNTLKDVPAQIIKLDMRFLESSTNSQRGGNIIESIVRMAKWINMSVIAEGVETLEQADFLGSIGCNYIQGYLYARPMPVEDYENLCRGIVKEERLLVLETVENLDNNSFWDPQSIDTLIFNSYVGNACIYEYHQDKIELIRATEKYIQMLGSLGMTIEEAFQLNWVAYLDEPSREKLRKNLSYSIESKKEITDEYLFVNLPSGLPETYLRSTLRIIAIAGERYLVYCINENITAQHKAEQKARRFSEQLQTIMRDMDSGITAAISKSNKVEFIFSNDQFYEIHGYTRKEYHQKLKNVFAIIHPEDQAQAYRIVMRTYLTDQPSKLEYRVIGLDQKERWVRVILSTTHFSGIKEKVQVCIFTDISLEKQAEQKLRNTSELLQSIMRDMPGGFVRMQIDSAGIVKPIYANEGFCKLTGMSYEEMLAIYGNDASAGVHPDDLFMVKEAVKQGLEKMEALSCRFRLRHGNGGYIWMLVLGRATQDQAGHKFLNIYYTDATEQMKAEEQQKELLDNLPYGAALYEFDGKQLSVIHLNKRYWELVNRPAVDHSKTSFLNLVHPEDQAIIQQELATAIHQKRDFVWDIRILYGKNEYRPFHIVGRIIRKEADKYAIYASYTPIKQEIISYQQILPIVLSTIMDFTTDLSFVKDKDYRYICSSRAFVNMVGLASESEVIGKTDYDLFEPEIADKYRRDDETLLASGKSLIDMVEAIPSTDGISHYSSTSKYLLRDAQGNIIGLYGVGRDITEYRDAFDKLELLTNSVPGGIVTYECWPDKIKIIYFNDGFCELFGTTREKYQQISSYNPVKRVFAEDLPGVMAQLEELVKNDIAMDCVYRVHTQNKGYKWINHKAVVADRQKDKVIVNALLQDVTEQRELLERLRLSEEENQLALKLGGNIICQYNIAERSMNMPPDVAASFHLSEEIQNVPYEPVQKGLISPESIDAYTNFFEAILKGSPMETVVFQHKYTQEWLWLEARSATVFSDEGKPVKAVITFQDITERMKKEAVYRRWQQSLEAKDPNSYTLFRCNLSKNASFDTREGSLLQVNFDANKLSFNERTLEYVEQCVWEEDKNKYLAFLNSDTLLANYYRGKRSDSLEYREQLSANSIRWLRVSVEMVEYPNSNDIEAYLMYENINDSKQIELKNKELAETDPLTGILNRNAFASRVEEKIRSAKLDTRHALLILDIDGFKLVNDVFGHGEGDQTLIDIAYSLRSLLKPEDLLGRLGGDEFLILLNDIPNAAAVASKAKQICEATHKSFSLEIEISSSIGIAITQYDGSDFETLYKKADSALYYVKGSGKNNYAFYHDNMENEHLVPEEDNPSSSALKKPEKKRRMLIVDDNAIDHQLLANIFKEEFIIEKAQDGNSALVRLRHYGSAISVVLLDLMMPGMDGFAVLEQMQSNSRLQAIPVIIVSSDESRETCLRTLRDGATDFITKPIDPKLLRTRVHSAISKAENERLRAKNAFLELQNDETKRYRTVLQRTGTVVVEYDWMKSEFTYDPSISDYIAGTYNGRKLWTILLSDLVTDVQTVKSMQEFIHELAGNRALLEGTLKVQLKTPSNDKHWFRLNVYKLANEFALTEKLILTFNDLEINLFNEFG